MAGSKVPENWAEMLGLEAEQVNESAISLLVQKQTQLLINRDCAN